MIESYKKSELHNRFIYVILPLLIMLGKIIDQKVLRLFIFIPQYESEG